MDLFLNVLGVGLALYIVLLVGMGSIAILFLFRLYKSMFKEDN